MGFSDLDLIYLVNFEETGGTFSVEYTIKAYNVTQADEFLQL